MHISLDDFLDMTPDEFVRAYNAYIEQQEQSFRTSWEQARAIAYQIALPYLKKPQPKMQNWWPFTWDNDVRPKATYDRETGTKRFNKLKERWKD